MSTVSFGALLFYFTPQGGKFSLANTIYFWPSLSLSQEEKGFDFGDGRMRHWVVALAFLFWTAGASW